jgi:uncharacterized protein (TIGR02001 family)
MKSTNWLLNRHVLGALCATSLLLGSASVFADEAAPAVEAAPAAAEAAAAPAEAAAPASDFTFTMNLGLYSEYMFRGVQTADGPAIQGGLDLGHSSGFYVGTWWSNINAKYFGEGAVPNSKGNHLETDWYAGFAKSFESGFGVNFLANYYLYPEGRKNPFTTEKYDSLELSAAFTYKWLTYTYYYIPTDYYGAKTSTGGDTDGADYHELKVIYPLPFGGLNLKTKIGYQKTGDLGAGCGNICYGDQGDWAIGINRDFAMPAGGGKSIGGFNAGLEYTDTFSTKTQDYYLDSSLKDVNEEQLWFYVKRTW